MKKDKHFVFDTNVVVSAVMLPDSPPARALRKALNTGTIVMSEECMDELSRVITHKKFDRYVSFPKRQMFLLYFEYLAGFVDIKKEITVCRDPDDNKFLSLAINARAACIVTGDTDLLELHPFQGIAIVNPSQFLAEMD